MDFGKVFHANCDLFWRGIYVRPETSLKGPFLSFCRGNVGDILDQKDQRGVKASLLKDLDLEQVLDRDVEHLSGGELQRFAIAVVAAQLADVYMIDEPSSYLDVRQRLKAAQVIIPSSASPVPL